MKVHDLITYLKKEKNHLKIPKRYRRSDSDDEREKSTRLFFAVRNGNLRKVQELLKAGADVNKVDNDGNTLQSWQKLQRNVIISYKKYRKKPLTSEQKEHNRRLASFRMRVENKIREVKIFKIMSHVYRNFQKKYNLRLALLHSE